MNLTELARIVRFRWRVAAATAAIAFGAGYYFWHQRGIRFSGESVVSADACPIPADDVQRLLSPDPRLSIESVGDRRIHIVRSRAHRAEEAAALAAAAADELGEAIRHLWIDRVTAERAALEANLVTAKESQAAAGAALARIKDEFGLKPEDTDVERAVERLTTLQQNFKAEDETAREAIGDQVTRILKERTRLAAAFLDDDAAGRGVSTLTKSIEEVDARAARVDSTPPSHTDAVTRPAPPEHRPTDLGLLAIISIGSAVVAAGLREGVDRVIRTPLQIMTGARLPVLGVVSTPEPDSDGPLAAAVLNSLGRARSLAVTSVFREEGKTTTALQLAVGFARLGRRTILVDADLRRGRVHDLLGHDNSDGLSSILEQKEEARSFLDAIQSGRDLPDEELARVLRTTDHENLLALATGPATADPAALLGSHRMRALVDRLVVLADLVVFDASEIDGCKDPIVLGAQVDATILVVRAGRTHRKDLVEARRALETARAKVAGAILTFAGRRESIGQEAPCRA